MENFTPSIVGFGSVAKTLLKKKPEILYTHTYIYMYVYTHIYTRTDTHTHIYIRMKTGVGWSDAEYIGTWETWDIASLNVRW